MNFTSFEVKVDMKCETHVHI